MKNHSIAFTVTVLLCVSAHHSAQARNWGRLYGYGDWTSDYRFHGASSSNRQPAVQGGLHWSMPDNFYAGVFVSAVRFQDFRNTSFETDFYGGRHFNFDNNDVNLQLLYSAFPDTAGHPSYAAPGVIYPTYNFFEASTELTHSFGALTLGGKATWSPQYGSHAGVLWAADASAVYAINDCLKASANWGHRWLTNGSDRSHWDVGATVTWRQQWLLDLRYYGTDIGPTHCYFRNWCEPAVVAKITYQLAVF